MAERYTLRGLLGQGTFGPIYLAWDAEHQTEVAIRELAPIGCQRNEQGTVQFPMLSESAQHRLRQIFLEESDRISRWRGPNVRRPFAWFSERGTVFAVYRALQQVRSLRDALESGESFGLDFWRVAMAAMQSLHISGQTHGDIRPSNILLTEEGILLADFGAARCWLMETAPDPVLFDPTFAPPERLQGNGPKPILGDVYSLAAVSYFALLGFPPTAPDARLRGAVLTPMLQARPDFDPEAAEFIESSLNLDPRDRPASVTEWSGEAVPFAQVEAGDIEILAGKLHALEGFQFSSRACPSCGGLMETAKPLKPHLCPVCRDGRLIQRQLSERLCPECRLGTLRPFENQGPMVTCPNCRVGWVTTTKKSLLSKERISRCETCEAGFESDAQGRVRTPGQDWEDATSWEKHRAESGRAECVWRCDSCKAQFDDLVDGRRRRMHPNKAGADTFFPAEWARIAVGLDPRAGNTECDACGADYDLQGDTLTLLNCRRDPFNYAKAYSGVPVALSLIPYVAVGKTSGMPGVVCQACGTEFDDAAPYLRLAATDNPSLRAARSQPYVIEDWHRIAQGLPTIDQVPEVRQALDAALREAFRNNEILMDSIWHGPAKTVEPRGEDWVELGSGTLTVTEDELKFGKLLSKWSIRRDAIVRIEFEDPMLGLVISGEEEPRWLFVSPQTLEIELETGRVAFQATAEDLAYRLLK